MGSPFLHAITARLVFRVTNRKDVSCGYKTVSRTLRANTQLNREKDKSKSICRWWVLVRQGEHL
jgi:hypothetical protein